MDSAAEERLREFVRTAISGDLDALTVELQELRRELRVVKGAAGLGDRLPAAERRQAVAELRAAGYSASVIAQAVGCHRMTVIADARALGLPPPTETLGRDGYTRRHNRAE